MRARVVLIVLGLGSVEVLACNAISGVGDFSFATASSTTSSSATSGGGPQSSSSGGQGGKGGAGGSGGSALMVPCLHVDCPAVPDAGACCYDNTLVHPPEDGRCVTGSPPTDGCGSSDIDSGRETRIECHGPDDCDGGVCCAKRIDVDAGLAFYKIVSCLPSCDSPDTVVCDGMTDSGCPAAADGGSLGCSQSQLLPTGYFVCK